MANPRRLNAKIGDIERFERGVFCVTLLFEQNFPRFKAGQFLHLALDRFDPSTGFWPESRVFSISSCDEDRRKVTFVYSVKGAYTKRMEIELDVGSLVWVKAPYGDFIIANHVSPGRPAHLVAGGTGISPFIPFLVAYGGESVVTLFYGVQKAALVLFESQLSASLSQDNFSLDLFVEEGDERPSLGRYDYHKGRLDVETVYRRTKGSPEGVYFLSGPPLMINAFQEGLKTLGVEDDSIKIDDWG